MERRQHGCQSGHPGPASMGPPPFGDGKMCSSRARLKTSLRFNGATAFRRWKVLNQASSAVVSALLQWGHRLSAMESTGVAADCGDAHTASMGPPPFGDGKAKPPPTRLTSSGGFNGATAFRRWKVRVGVSRRDARPASMGPPPFGDGKSAATSVSNALHELQWGHRLSAMESS